MTRGSALRLILAALCVLLCALLAAGAVSIYREGAALRAAGDAAAPVYTREKALDRLAPAAPVALAVLALAFVGALAGVRGKAVGKGAKASRMVPADPPGRGARIARVALLALAAGLVAAGVLNGSARDVWVKAVNICAECVGLG